MSAIETFCEYAEQEAKSQISALCHVWVCGSYSCSTGNCLETSDTGRKKHVIIH